MRLIGNQALFSEPTSTIYEYFLTKCAGKSSRFLILEIFHVFSREMHHDPLKTTLFHLRFSGQAELKMFSCFRLCTFTYICINVNSQSREFKKNVNYLSFQIRNFEI
jgi:hypothetical protein